VPGSGGEHSPLSDGEQSLLSGRAPGGGVH